MQLREAETLGVRDDHDRRFGHVDADLDDRGRDQDLRRPWWNRSIAASRSGPAILPCISPTARPNMRAEGRRAILRRRHVDRLDPLDQRAHQIGLLCLRASPAWVRATNSTIRSIGMTARAIR